MSKRLLLFKGFTLVEVMIAISITAIIATLAYQSLSSASISSERTEQAMARIEQIDRAWILLENDLRNAVLRTVKQPFGETLPSMQGSFGGEYSLLVLRAGLENPLALPRSEVVRVGYRLQENILWRDSWINLMSSDPLAARKQKLLGDVEEVQVQFLSPEASSVKTGPWLEEWPGTGAAESLPLAVSITLNLKDMGEVQRLFALLPGKGNS